MEGMKDKERETEGDEEMEGKRLGGLASIKKRRVDKRKRSWSRRKK